MTRAIGIDFGTTNSVVALVNEAGQVSNAIWPSSSGLVDIFRTALFFWSEGRALHAAVTHAAGPQALERALAGTGEGRFIQSIKTYLASRSFTDTRLFGQRFGIEDLVAIFLRHLSTGFDASDGVPVVAGRPVVFAGDRPDDERAVARLTDAYRLAGLPNVQLAFEPMGAAYWYARGLTRDETVLVADFGGGTSDFSVIRFARRPSGLVAEPLGHAGVGVAGDTFDYRLIDHLVAPQLGKGSHYRSFDKSLPFPAYVHAAFARWHQLSWLKSPQTMRELRSLASVSEAPDAIEKLIAFLDLDLGFELYQAISAVKTRLSFAEDASLDFDRHGLVLRGRIERRTFERLIAEDLAQIDRASQEALTRAGLAPTDIDAVFMTGGTSYVPAVRALFADRFGAGRLHVGEAFQSVAAGLALMADDRRLLTGTATQ